MASRSKLFCPYKVVGLVSLGMPFIFDYCPTKKRCYIKIPIGNMFHIHDALHLKLVDVSKSLPSNITCLVSGSETDCSATENGSIQVWKKGTNELKTQFKCHDTAISLLCVIGSTIVSVDVENTMKVSLDNGSLYLTWRFSSDTFKITVLFHPPTYLNKVLIGSKQGGLQLLNIKTSKVIYQFAGWNSAVNVIDSAPAIDVVAIGLKNGQIIIHNIKSDENIMTLQQEAGQVTSLSFRSDNNARLLSGSSHGTVYVWDLQEKSLKSSINKAHRGPVLSLACASKESIAYTSSTDNALKRWNFDLSDGGGRILKSLEGHSEPPLRVRYHGQRADGLFSAGQDSALRMAVVQHSESVCIARAVTLKTKNKWSSKAVDLKMPPIVSFTTEAAREKVWDSVAAIHQNSCEVSTYSIYLKKMNEKKLVHGRFSQPTFNNAMATCINISMCGNFVHVGFNAGYIDKYNIQSGIFQLSYGIKAHETAVRGIVTDSLNHWLVSGDQDGTLQWWHHNSGTKDKTLELHSGVCSMTINRDSGLFAIALDEWDILIADIDTKNVVRKLHGHENQITDLAFTADSQRLMSASMDCSIRTWDLPTGTLVDHFKVPSPATSIALSPLDDYLASTHINHLGVYLWFNRSYLTFISLEPLGKDYLPPLLPLPGAQLDGSEVFDSDSDGSDNDEDIELDDYKSADQLSKEFVTIDLMPASRWLHLLNIDHIKKRSKPDEAPRAPKTVSFFLGSVATLGEDQNQEDENVKSKVIDRSKFVLESLSEFATSLKNCNHDQAFQLLLVMGPSNIDLEIRNLDPDVGGSKEAMLQFLVMIKKIVGSRMHCEVAQGYLALFMKRHADYLTSPDPDVKVVCEDLAEQHTKSWQTLKEDGNRSLSLLSYFKNSAILNH